MKNNDEILKKIKDLKTSYQVELADSNEESMSFLDQINSLIRSIFDDSSLSVYTVFSEKRLEEWKKKRFTRWFKNTIIGSYTKGLYLILLATITGFLVSEALDFYAGSHPNISIFHISIICSYDSQCSTVSQI